MNVFYRRRRNYVFWPYVARQLPPISLNAVSLYLGVSMKLVTNIRRVSGIDEKVYKVRGQR